MPGFSPMGTGEGRDASIAFRTASDGLRALKGSIFLFAATRYTQQPSDGFTCPQSRCRSIEVTFRSLKKEKTCRALAQRETQKNHASIALGVLDYAVVSGALRSCAYLLILGCIGNTYILLLAVIIFGQ
jgi:hypothetical protein